MTFGAEEHMGIICSYLDFQPAHFLFYLALQLEQRIAQEFLSISVHPVFMEGLILLLPTVYYSFSKS